MSASTGVIDIDNNILRVTELSGSDAPPYDFPIPGISPSSIIVDPNHYIERLKELRFESDEDEDIRTWTPRVRSELQIPSLTPRMPGHFSISSNILRPDIKTTERDYRALARCNSDLHSLPVQNERKELCRLFRTIFRPPLPEERVEDMADLIITITSMAQVKETVQGLESLIFPADLVVSRIGVILGFQELGQNSSTSSFSNKPNEELSFSLYSTPPPQETTTNPEMECTINNNSTDVSILQRWNSISPPKIATPVLAASPIQASISQSSAVFNTPWDSPLPSAAINSDADTPKSATLCAIASENHNTNILASTSSDIVNHDSTVTLEGPAITCAAVPRLDSPNDDDETSSGNVGHSSEENHDPESSASDEGSHNDLTPRWAERTITTTKTKMYWTTSDGPGDLPYPTVPGAAIGHIHLHRNSDADHVQVWLLEAESTWVDYSSRYGSTNEPFIKHPIYSALVLTTRGRKKAPSFVAIPYLRKKIQDHTNMKKARRNLK